jgi:hypothetical protein
MNRSVVRVTHRADPKQQVAPGGFIFNQFLVDADDPLLFHTRNFADSEIIDLGGKQVRHLPGLFFSDNRGCAELMREDGWARYYPKVTNDGNKVALGNIPNLRPGSAQTSMSYELPWAEASADSGGVVDWSIQRSRGRRRIIPDELTRFLGARGVLIGPALAVTMSANVTLDQGTVS